MAMRQGGQPMNKPSVILTATEAKQAYISWATDDIKSVTSVRFEAAKFFFSVSSATVGFIVTTWKVFHDKSDFSVMVMIGLFLSTASVLFAIYMFWPMFYMADYETDLQDQHSSLLRRLKCEGLIWMLLWVTGSGLGVYGTFA